MLEKKKKENCSIHLMLISFPLWYSNSIIARKQNAYFYETDATPPKEKLTGAMLTMHMQNHHLLQPSVYHDAVTQLNNKCIWFSNPRPAAARGERSLPHPERVRGWHSIKPVYCHLDFITYPMLKDIQEKHICISLELCLYISVTISNANTKDPCIGLTKIGSAEIAFCTARE